MGKFIQVAICSAVLVFSAGLASANHVKCSRDLNNDEKVDRKDMKIIENAFGSKLGKAPYDERADINQDGFVNSGDRDDYKHCLPPALDRKRRGSN